MDRPRVGLLSVGEEEGKGNDLTREAYDLLKESKLNFISAGFVACPGALRRIV